MNNAIETRWRQIEESMERDVSNSCFCRYVRESVLKERPGIPESRISLLGLSVSPNISHRRRSWGAGVQSELVPHVRYGCIEVMAFLDSGLKGTMSTRGAVRENNEASSLKEA